MGKVYFLTSISSIKQAGGIPFHFLFILLLYRFEFLDWKKANMRNAALFVLLIFVVTGCNRRDAELRRKIAGTWALGEHFSCVLATNGIFHSELNMGATNNIPQFVRYEGNWEVKDQYLIFSLTRIENPNSLKAETVGSIDRFKITRVENNLLECECGGEKYLYQRKK